MSGQQSWRLTGWRASESHGAVEIVDLTDPDQEEVIPARWAVRDPAAASGIVYESDSNAGDGSRPGDSQDSPIVLGEDDDDSSSDYQPDTKLDATTSEDDDEPDDDEPDDDDQTIEATPPADRDGSHSSLPAIRIEPFAIGPSVYSAAGSAADIVSRDDFDDIKRERPSTRQGAGPSRPHGEVAEADCDTPQEKTFGEDSRHQEPKERRQWGQPSSRPTDSNRDGSLALTSPSGESVLDERSIEGPDHTASRKWSAPSVGPGAPLESGPPPKRLCRSRMAARTAREACRGNEWGVVDIGGVYLEENGSWSCKLLWEPTMAPVSSLSGALLERAEELVKEEHGAEAWEKWLEKQGTTGRRRRRRRNGGKS